MSFGAVPWYNERTQNTICETFFFFKVGFELWSQNFNRSYWQMYRNLSCSNEYNQKFAYGKNFTNNPK